MELVKSEHVEYKTEAGLCAAFSEEMTRQGWTCYPETSGWDILLVGHEMQVGVEAKLKPTMGVLAQVAGRMAPISMGRGPNYAVVLVSRAAGEFEAVVKALGAAIIHPRQDTDWHTKRKTVYWPNLLQKLDYATPLHFNEPAWIPDVMPDVAAGCSAPVRLTPWKVSALRLIARLEVRGYVTIADFRDLGLHPSRWYHFWLLPAPTPERETLFRKKGERLPQRWVRRPEVPLADAQHPRAFATILDRERARLASMAEKTS